MASNRRPGKHARVIDGATARAAAGHSAAGVRVLLVLGAIVLASMLLALATLSREHGWGDDFASYIMQARGLAFGGVSDYVQRSGFIIQNSAYWYVPVTYPWGFPLLLAPVVRLFGVKMLALKLVSTACFVSFLFVFFLFARRRLRDSEALLLTAVLGFNPVLLAAQNEIGPDFPFLLFSMLALWLMDLIQECRAGNCIWITIAAGCAIFLGAFTRSNGLVLLAPLAFVQALMMHRQTRRPGESIRTWATIAIPYAVLGLLYSIQAVLLPSSPYDALGILGSATPGSILDNIGYYFWLPASMFRHLGWGANVVYLLLLLGLLINVPRLQQRDISLYVFALALLAPYILMPAVQGIRYIFPLLPVILILSYQGIKALPRWIQGWHTPAFSGVLAVIWAALALSSLAAGISQADRNLRAGRYPLGRSDGAYSPAADEMFEYIRKHTPADGVVMFFRPRAMMLRTDRLAFLSAECGRLSQADYVVLVANNPDTDQVPRTEVQHCNSSVVLTPVYDKDEFTIFQIDPAG